MTETALHFNIADPLPWGRAAIGASAGTGKTWTLAALATRYVAETDIPVSGLLVVTFTRAAAAELRNRIRSRFTEAAVFCESSRPAEGEEDALLAHLAGLEAVDGVPGRIVAARRLRAALAEFDAATIGTIHGFAQQVLSSLGSASHPGAAASLDENTVALIEEVATDVLVDAAQRSGGPVLPNLADVRRAAMKILNNPGIRVVPEVGDTDSDEALMQADIVRRVVKEIGRRQQEANTIGYTGLLTSVRDVLADPDHQNLTSELRQQFRVGLVDEFQDTDPVQWEIFSRLFPPDAGNRRALIVVGDPKQAIYAFRGANVHTYVEATARADAATLGHNYRSDANLLTALGALFDGAVFGPEEIAFQTVEAAQPASRLRIGDSVPPALVIRTVSSDNPNAVTQRGNRVRAASGHDIVAADLADRAVDLLANGEIAVPAAPDAPDPPEGEWRGRRVQAHDIAVLVTAYSQVPRIQTALARRGIPSVVARTGNVFDSEAAQHWQWLLHGLARPADSTRARMVALSWFLPWTADDVVSFTEAELTALQARLAAWSDALEEHGVVALTRMVWSEGDVLARLLEHADGERLITDLDHIGEVLAAEVGDDATSALGLLAMFNELALENPDEAGRNDAISRRLESDDNAVQIMTVHVSKGLEFPIVLCPTLWTTTSHARISTSWQSDGERIYDVANSLDWPTKAEAVQRVDLSKREDVAERLRLGYVALTRAAHQVITWWVPGANNGATLGRLLFARDGARINSEKLLAPKGTTPPLEQADVHQFLDAFVLSAGGTVAVQEVPTRALTARTVAPVGDTAKRDLGAAGFTRTFDRDWRRWSFTAATAGLYERHQEQARLSEDLADERGASDEPLEVEDPVVIDAVTTEDVSPVPLADVGAGAAFGTLVHHALEVVDFTDPDLEGALERALLARHELAREMVDAPAVARGLVHTIRTPLGDGFGSVSMADLTFADRLDELDFDLPLAVEGPAVTIAEIGSLLVRHGTGTPTLDAWAQELADGAIEANLRGFLTGSIDGVFRLRGGADAPTQADRFVVVDYKSNLLGEPFRLAVSDDYHPDRVAEAMVHHHYPLQALLYSVALHRYLRWRLPAYDPDVHLGGIAYLFVRGMTGPDTPMVDGVPHGVFAWHPASALIEELSALLHGRRP